MSIEDEFSPLLTSPTPTMTSASLFDPPVQSGNVIPRSIAVMSIVLNLAISESFQTVDTTSMTFPSEMKIDYIRVYQRSDAKNVGCDPDEYPTAKYIESHLNAYMSMCCISFFPLSSFLH